MQKRKDIRNFYVYEEFIPIWNKFKKICEREDESISEKIRGFIARYVSVHDKGNPQLMLEPFIGETKRICWKCRGQFPNLIHVKFISGLTTRICSICLEDYQKRDLVKHIYRK